MADQIIPNEYADIAGALSDDMSWAYKTIVRAGRLYHEWHLRGPRGGIHVHAMWHPSRWSGDNWLGGIEGHSPIPQSDWNADKPSHEHCWLIGRPCWHDGSSLQFSEEIAPMLLHQDRAMGEYEHRAVLSTLLHRYNIWLPEASAIEAASAGETRSGSTEGESAAPEGGDAQ